MMRARERFLAACRCGLVDRPPIWIMRQAGRYLPEYRELRKRYSFLELVKNPELAATVTLQPLNRFEFDAAIIFSDILVIPEALGQPYCFRDTGGIAMDYRVDSVSKIEALNGEAINERLAYVADALGIVRKELGDRRALIGFCGAPWTVATYMVEGGSSRVFSRVVKLYHQEPKLFRALMEKITAASIEYLRMQTRAGVDAIQIFDSWGSACPDADYDEMSLAWIRKIIASLPSHLPVILYARGMSRLAVPLSRTGARVLSLDSSVRLSVIRRSLPEPIAFQGNLAPEILDTEPAVVVRETRAVLEDMKPYRGHILNLGHGIKPTARIENVQAMVDAALNFP